MARKKKIKNMSVREVQRALKGSEKPPKLLKGSKKTDMKAWGKTFNDWA